MKEIFLMTGFSFIGMLFVPAKNLMDPINLLAASASILFYVMAVFFLNSYAGYEGDAKSARLKHVSSVSKNSYLKLTILSICMFCVCALATSSQLLLVMVVSIALWFAYYLKPVQLKTILFGGTLAHFLGGALHFHMGYTAFELASLESVQVSIFFSLILCTGHFNHEMMDAEDDKKSGQHTTTVRLGAGTALTFRNLFALLASVYAMMLLHWELVAKLSGVTLSIASAIMLLTSLFAKQKTKMFQKTSRAIFFLAGLLVILEKLSEIGFTWWPE